MKITRSNYETFFLDYLENNLDESMRSEVEHFVKFNPDLVNELEMFHEMILKPQEIKRNLNKEYLKKDLLDLIPSNFNSVDDFLVAEIENDLNSEQKILLQRLLILEPDLQKELELLRKTKLLPDKNVTFNAKENLKKRKFVLLSSDFGKYMIPLAAAAILIVLFLFINRQSIKQSNTELSIKKEINQNDLKTNDKIYENKTNDKLAENRHEKRNESNRKSTHLNVSSKTTINSSLKKTNESTTIPVNPVKRDTITEIGIAALENQMTNSVNTEFNAWIIRNENPHDKAPEREVYTLNQYLHKKFRVSVLNENEQEAENRKFSLWDIADIGIQRIGKILNKDIQLQKQYNEEGYLTSLEFCSPNLAFNAPLKKR